jgi:hypothetical protein
MPAVSARFLPWQNQGIGDPVDPAILLACPIIWGMWKKIMGPAGLEPTTNGL